MHLPHRPTILAALGLWASLSFPHPAHALYNCQYYQSAGVCPAPAGSTDYDLCKIAYPPTPASTRPSFVPTTIDHSFNPYVRLSRCDVDARDRGAMGDGVTDDTTAIQEAINLTPAGGTLCITNGTYIIDASEAARSGSAPLVSLLNRRATLSAGAFDDRRGA